MSDDLGVSRETRRRGIFCEMQGHRGEVVAAYRMVWLKGEHRTMDRLLCRRHVTAWFDFALERGVVAVFEIEVLR